jgi:hypothetical protein
LFQMKIFKRIKQIIYLIDFWTEEKNIFII